MNNEAPERLFVQLAQGSLMVSAYRNDPREVHDNGQPGFRYRLESNDRNARISIIEGRPRSKRKDWNAFAWRPVATATATSNSKQALRLHKEARPTWEFRVRNYVRLENE